MYAMDGPTYSGATADRTVFNLSSCCRLGPSKDFCLHQACDQMKVSLSSRVHSAPLEFEFCNFAYVPARLIHIYLFTAHL